MRKLLKALIFVPIAVYALYVAAIALFLNTPIFAKVTQMTNTESTHIRFVGAWSLIPGTIHAAVIHVNIREPDIELDINLHRPLIHFDFAGLLLKQAHLTSIHVEETTVAVRAKKKPEEKVERLESKKDRERTANNEEIQKLATRWTISADHVELPNISEIAIEKNRLVGKTMAIDGAFMLQPGTRCEIYPSTFNIEGGKWNDEITDISFASRVQFHRFYKSHLTGSEVLRYVDAHFEGTAKANGLQFVNVTLRSLGDYGFGNGTANLRANIDIKSGKILGGSSFDAEKGVIRLSSSRFDLVGNGGLEWRALAKGNASTLHAEITGARTEVRIGKNRLTGKVKRVIGDAKIMGLGLDAPFTGLSARLKVVDGQVASEPLVKTETNEFAYFARARIGGELAAVAGDYPDEAGIPKPSNFSIDIDDSAVRIPKVGLVVGTGKVALAVKTIDFRDGRADLPTLTVKYRGVLDDKYPIDLIASTKNASRVFGLKNSGDNHWRGDGELKLSQFNGLLDYLRDTKKISAIIRAGLNATEVSSAMAWEVTPDESRLEVRELDSNGIWSGFGTLVSEKADDGAPSDMHGQFKAKILGLPVGIGLDGKDVKVKLFSGRGPVETSNETSRQ
jgi:hypothetical protein